MSNEHSWAVRYGALQDGSDFNEHKIDDPDFDKKAVVSQYMERVKRLLLVAYAETNTMDTIHFELGPINQILGIGSIRDNSLTYRITNLSWVIKSCVRVCNAIIDFLQDEPHDPIIEEQIQDAVRSLRSGELGFIRRDSRCHYQGRAEDVQRQIDAMQVEALGPIKERLEAIASKLVPTPQEEDLPA